MIYFHSSTLHHIAISLVVHGVGETNAVSENQRSCRCKRRECSKEPAETPNLPSSSSSSSNSCMQPAPHFDSMSQPPSKMHDRTVDSNATACIASSLQQPPAIYRAPYFFQHRLEAMSGGDNQSIAHFPEAELCTYAAGGDVLFAAVDSIEDDERRSRVRDMYASSYGAASSVTPDIFGISALSTAASTSPDENRQPSPHPTLSVSQCNDYEVASHAAITHRGSMMTRTAALRSAGLTLKEIPSTAPTSGPPSLFASSAVSPAPDFYWSQQNHHRCLLDRLELECDFLMRKYRRGWERLSPRLVRLMETETKRGRLSVTKSMSPKNTAKGPSPSKEHTMSNACSPKMPVRVTVDPMVMLRRAALLAETKFTLEEDVWSSKMPVSQVDATLLDKKIAEWLLPLDACTVPLDHVPAEFLLRIFKFFDGKPSPNLVEYSSGVWDLYVRLLSDDVMLEEVKTAAAHPKSDQGAGVQAGTGRDSTAESISQVDVDPQLMAMQHDLRRGSVSSTDTDWSDFDAENVMEQLGRAERCFLPGPVCELYADIDIEAYGLLGMPLALRVDDEDDDVSWLPSTDGKGMVVPENTIGALKRAPGSRDPSTVDLESGRAKRRRRSTASINLGRPSATTSMKSSTDDITDSFQSEMPEKPFMHSENILFALDGRLEVQFEGCAWTEWQREFSRFSDDAYNTSAYRRLHKSSNELLEHILNLLGDNQFSVEMASSQHHSFVDL